MGQGLQGRPNRAEKRPGRRTQTRKMIRGQSFPTDSQRFREAERHSERFREKLKEIQRDSNFAEHT